MRGWVGLSALFITGVEVDTQGHLIRNGMVNFGRMITGPPVDVPVQVPPGLPIK